MREPEEVCIPLCVWCNLCVVCVVGGESRARVKTCLAVLHLALILSIHICLLCPPCLPVRLSAYPPVCAIGHSQARPADAAPVPLVVRQALLAKLSPLVDDGRRHAIELGRKPRCCSAAVLQCYCYCKSISVWQAGSSGRRNKTSRDALDAAIFSPREYVSICYL